MMRADAMPNLDQSKLDFAYRYPFSKEAKEIIAEVGTSKVEGRYVEFGLVRLEEALNSERMKFVRTEINDLKLTFIKSYAYARMLVSATGNAYATQRYVSSEAARSAEALASDTIGNVTKLANELELTIKEHGAEFFLDFETFVSVKKSQPQGLVNQQVQKGRVFLSRSQVVQLVHNAMKGAIGERLPIPKKDLPKEIMEAAKKLKISEPRIAVPRGSGSYAWIDRLLANPIPDIRHRSVNLIFAPYLVNVKKLDEETAAQIIISYIEQCKKLNPTTKINDSYIRYQCKYAKSRGLSPLSLTRAKELLKGVAEFE